MKRFQAAAATGILFCLVGVIKSDVLIKPNTTNINYSGRFDFSKSADSVTFNWPGCIIEANFPGPSIGVDLRDGGAFFDVEIDGVRSDSLPAANPSTATRRTIKTGLSTDIHTVRIILRTNDQFCSFRGFYIADGKTLAPPPPKPTRKIEFIGDSWTAGDVIFALPGGSGGANTFEANLTYARLTSKAFHAEDHLTAKGGCGLIKSQGGAAVMATRFPQTLHDRATPLWDFASWKPDLVSMFLGINDFGIGGVTDQDFRTAYISLINTVRSKYPNVPIILIGINSDQSGHNILTNIQAMAPQLTGITVFSSPITLSNASALYQHPNRAQHKMISDSLIPVIRRIMDWDTTTPVGVAAPKATQRGQFAPGAAMKVTHDRIALSSRLAGAKEIAAYDCRGRLLQKIITKKQAVLISRDLGLPPGMYLIKATAQTR